MKGNFKNVIISMVCVIIACDSEPAMEQDELNFCSCLNLEDIHKTIPLVNGFLAELPTGTSMEETFVSLETWLNSFPCNIDSKILYGINLIDGLNKMYAVAVRVNDHNISRELELDFAIVDNALAYSQIMGYRYYKQDAIHVKTQFTEIDQVFDFINTHDFSVKEIQGGIYLSSMAAIPDTLQYIINNLKAKPYTTDSWVAGHLNWYDANIAVSLRLHFMENSNYQTDWLQTMCEYKFNNYVNGPKHIVEFFIPEGTGEQWETYFTAYDFVDWAELSHTRYTIQG